MQDRCTAACWSKAFSQRPERFKRHDSEKPSGGWFCATTCSPGSTPSSPSDSDTEESSAQESSIPPSPPSSALSESSDSSDLDTDSEMASGKGHHHRGHRWKSKKSMLKNLKIKNPFTYDGSDDLDRFDQWTYEVNTWRQLYRVRDKDAVYVLVQFLSGKAGKFFMKHVANSKHKWSVTDVYEGLFDYCFPTHFKLALCEKLMNTVQGNMSVRDYA